MAGHILKRLERMDGYFLLAMPSLALVCSIPSDIGISSITVRIFDHGNSNCSTSKPTLIDC